jgi:hypothetical protein
MLGGYVSGVSLIAAPLVVPVAASRMPKRAAARHAVRALVCAGGAEADCLRDQRRRPAVDSAPVAAALAAIGHCWVCAFTATPCADTRVFFRYLGIALLLVSAGGAAGR